MYKRQIQVILCQDLPVHGIAQQVRQGLHGEAVLVRHIDPGGPEGRLGEGTGGLRRTEGQLRPPCLVPPDGQVLVERPDGRLSGKTITPQVSQGVLQPVRRQLGGVVVGDGVTVVVRHVRRGETVLPQQGLKLRRPVDQLCCSPLGGLLPQMVAVEKVHHMGKGRGGRVVEQPRRALPDIAGEVPDCLLYTSNPFTGMRRSI